jgi:hypothetical protein
MLPCIEETLCDGLEGEVPHKVRVTWPGEHLGFEAFQQPTAFFVEVADRHQWDGATFASEVPLEVTPVFA